MDELRSEIRAAFEKEQAANPPSGGMRANVVAAASTQSLPAPSLQWIAVAVAALLGLLVVAGLMSTRLGPRASVPGNLTDYGPPPAGVPLLYVHDLNHPSWLIGFDWSRNPRGTVKLRADLVKDPSAVTMTPDGSGFEEGGTYKGGTGTFLDRLGNPISTEAGPTDFVGAMWADDNQHQCVLTLSSTYVWRLGTQLPGQGLRPVAVVARDKGIGQSGISLAACSFHNEVAIVLRTTIAWPAELWVINLSDGTVLSHHFYSASGLLAMVVASPDGVYVAESSAKGRGFDSSDTLRGAASTIIRRVSDWQVVRSLDSSVQVLGFSGDGSYVLISTPSTSGLMQYHYSGLDWRRNIASWSYDGEWTLYSFTAQPGGRSIAVALGDAPIPRPVCVTPASCPVSHSVRMILIGDPDASGIGNLGEYTPAW